VLASDAGGAALVELAIAELATAELAAAAPDAGGAAF